MAGNFKICYCILTLRSGFSLYLVLKTNRKSEIQVLVRMLLNIFRKKNNNNFLPNIFSNPWSVKNVLTLDPIRIFISIWSETSNSHLRYLPYLNFIQIKLLLRYTISYTIVHMQTIHMHVINEHFAFCLFPHGLLVAKFFNSLIK